MPTSHTAPTGPEAYLRAVNMLPDALEEWLETAESASVGIRAPGASRSTGQLAGLRTLELAGTDPDGWSASDLAHAARTVGFVRRHRAQWPSGDVTDRRWRHALRNWGHDPLWGDRLRIESAGSDLCTVVVDDSPAGELRLDEGIAGVLVEGFSLSPEARGRGLAAAVLHRVAVETGRPVEVELTDDDQRWATVMTRRGFVPLDAEAGSTRLVLPAL